MVSFIQKVLHVPGLSSSIFRDNKNLNAKPLLPLSNISNTCKTLCHIPEPHQ